MTAKAVTKSAPTDDVVKVSCSACKSVIEVTPKMYLEGETGVFKCAGDGCERDFCKRCADNLPVSNTCEDCGCDHKSAAPGLNEYEDGCSECDCDCMCDSMPSMVICKVCQRIAKREEDKKKKQFEEEEEEEDHSMCDDEGEPLAPAKLILSSCPIKILPPYETFTRDDLEASIKRTGKPNQKFTETLKEMQAFRKSQAPSTRGTKRSSEALSSSSSSSSSAASTQSPSKKAKPAKQGSKKVV